MPTLNQIRDYLQGTIRMKMYENPWSRKYLLSDYVLKQFEERIDKAKDCYNNGACLHCGCKTPDLFFADRACSKEEPCYEAMIPWYKRIMQN
jgi:hypothetical protein